MIIIIIIIKIKFIIVINSCIIIKDNYNDRDDENNAQNTDNKNIKKYFKKIESLWMIIFNNKNYNNHT